ncbi:MAG TPA: DUF58 domain-containing protein [Phycisphaerales bacterium]|nr:DUF58 domain-containing protein [Phycisphaerales bacterium]
MQRRYHLHIPAIVYGIMVILVALAAMSGQNNLLFWIFGVMFAGLILSGMLSGMMMLGLTVRRLDPQHGAVGEPLLVQYEVRNTNRFLPAFNIHIEERRVAVKDGDSAARGWSDLMASPDAAGAWVMHIAPRDSAHGEAAYWPIARGEARFDRIRIWTTFPFGLIKKSITISQPQHTLIFPRLYELRPDVLRAASPPAALGHKTTSRPGVGDDYYGLREHRSGDSVRNIAWKRSAMLDQLVAVERSMPSPPRLRVILNLTTPTAQLRVGTPKAATKNAQLAAAREAEEQAISLAASLLHAAHHAGYEIGMTVLGFDMPAIAMRRSHWHLRRILSALAGINLDATRRPPIAGSVADAERAALIIVHPDRVDPSASRPDAVHFTSAQLSTLAVKPLGWSITTPQQDSQEAPPTEHRSLRAVAQSALRSRHAESARSTTRGGAA